MFQNIGYFYCFFSRGSFLFADLHKNKGFQLAEIPFFLLESTKKKKNSNRKKRTTKIKRFFGTCKPANGDLHLQLQMSFSSKHKPHAQRKITALATRWRFALI